MAASYINFTEKPMRVGTVFSYMYEKINWGKKIGKNLIEVGFNSVVVGIDAANAVRQNVKYVIEQIKWTDEEPDTNYSSNAEVYVPRYYARRLNEDGTYNPEGEVIVFNGHYSFGTNLSLYSMNLHKVMRKIVNFVDVDPTDTEQIEE